MGRFSQKVHLLYPISRTFGTREVLRTVNGDFSKSYAPAYLCGKFMIYGKNRKSQETESQVPTVRTERVMLITKHYLQNIVTQNEILEILSKLLCFLSLNYLYPKNFFVTLHLDRYLLAREAYLERTVFNQLLLTSKIVQNGFTIHETKSQHGDGRSGRIRFGWACRDLYGGKKLQSVRREKE